MGVNLETVILKSNTVNYCQKIIIKLPLQLQVTLKKLPKMFSIGREQVPLAVQSGLF